MLILSRRPNQKILFPTLGITVEIASISRNVVRVGIDAPPKVPIVREEIASAADRLAFGTPHKSDHQLRNRLNTAGLALHLAQKQLAAGFTQDAEATLNEALIQYSALDRELDVASRATSKRALRALLIEDNRNESALLAEFLRLHGINVQLANDGQDALDFLRSHERPDVILLDMHMPRLDGPTTLAAIRGNAAYDETKVFAVSGCEQEDVALPKGCRGLDGWFSKPVNPARLIEEMNLAVRLN